MKVKKPIDRIINTLKAITGIIKKIWEFFPKIISSISDFINGSIKAWKLLVVLLISILAYGWVSDKVIDIIRYPKLQLSEQEGEIIFKKSFNVLKIINEKQTLIEAETVFKQRYLLLHEGKDLYFDNQKIQISDNGEIRIIGSYQYKYKGKLETIPVIKIKTIEKEVFSKNSIIYKLKEKFYSMFANIKEKIKVFKE